MTEKRTDSGIEVRPLYDAQSLTGFDADSQLGAPGGAPYTRGVYPTMHRDRLWTMRQYAGFGTAADTNARLDRKSTRLNSSHIPLSRMPSSA